MSTSRSPHTLFLRYVAPWWGIVSDRLAFLLAVLATASGIATWAALTKQPFFSHDATSVTILLTLDLVFILLLGSLLGARILGILRARHGNGQSGRRLHTRMVRVFTLLAAVPAISVALFTIVFFYFGIETWFSERVRTALDESQEVAQAYLEEHQKVLRADVLAMANDLNRRAFLLAEDPLQFSQFVAAQADVRSLTEAIVFDGSGRIIARSALSFSLSFEPVSDDMREKARQGEVVLLVSGTDDRVRALVRLDNFVDTYLFVGRLVDPQVLTRVAHTEHAVGEYRKLRDHSAGLRVTIALIFVVIAVLLMLVAVWFGLDFANMLVRPISALIDATERVRRGDLSARVILPDNLPHLKDSEDELIILSAAFNRMTGQLAAQRADVMQANMQIDERRRFTEAVLSGVSAGVVGLDMNQKITLINAAAAAFFGADDSDNMRGKHLSELAPEIAELLSVMPQEARFHDGQVEVRRAGQIVRTLFVRVATLGNVGKDALGFVVTFDDLSALVSAQRKAAWGDVARRIAHEIRNPLTPIQLAAGRLQRKYKSEIKTDPDVFISCIETIIRNVDDIGNMVDEFSAFARMPAPVMRTNDIRDLARQAVFAQATGRPYINYIQEIPEGEIFADCDGRQIVQALTNILKNAAEAVESRCKHEHSVQGEIVLRLENIFENGSDAIQLTVIDNGTGLPTDERERLFEPYVTTRSKGTGLGLAIVRKIMEDHRGTLTLSDRGDSLQGAEVALIWPRTLCNDNP